LSINIAIIITVEINVINYKNLHFYTYITNYIQLLVKMQFNYNQLQLQIITINPTLVQTQ